MNRLLPLFLFLFIPGMIHAQEETWATDIAPIIYENCSHCHRDGGIGPFPLMSYDDVSLMAEDVRHAVEEREMPPWPADPEYRHFKDELYLSWAEIEAIGNWIDEGKPFGDPADEPDAPTFEVYGSNLNSIDFIAQIEPYTLQYDIDEYRWFVIETNFPIPVYIKAIEVIPGLANVIHHADVSYDLSGISLANDQADPLSGFNGNTGGPNYDFYMNAWQPGAGPARYPEDWAIELPPGADLVFEIHYGPGGQGQTDTTKMNFEFMWDPTGARPVYASWLLGDSPPILQEPQLYIPANLISTFHQVTAPVNYSRSLISICPHMHLLGKLYKVWMETAEGDSIPLIDIPQWDFHWQMYYTFQQVQVVPPGAIIKSIGVYDNTLNNPENPHNPPQDVYKGLTTEDEMFLCYFIWSNYEEGDEDIILDSTFTPLNIQEPSSQSEYLLFPNPANSAVYVQGDFKEDTQILILDQIGRKVKEHMVLVRGMDAEKVWISDLPTGIYFVKVVGETRTEVYRLVVER